MHIPPFVKILFSFQSQTSFGVVFAVAVPVQKYHRTISSDGRSSRTNGVHTQAILVCAEVLLVRIGNSQREDFMDSCRTITFFVHFGDDLFRGCSSSSFVEKKQLHFSFFFFWIHRVWKVVAANSVVCFVILSHVHQTIHALVLVDHNFHCSLCVLFHNSSSFVSYEPFC